MSKAGKPHRLMGFVALLTIVLSAIIGSLIYFHSNGAAHAAGVTGSHHYFYDFPNGEMNVYDMDNNFALVQAATIPTTNVRGVVFDPASGMLYITTGGDGGSNGHGSLVKYNLLTESTVWTQNYNFGVDSLAITGDGKTIYLPDGASSFDGTWHVINTSNGAVITSIFTNTGDSPHDGDMGDSGKYVYFGDVNNSYLRVVSTATNKVTEQIGPLKGGVRPFVINKAETMAFTTATNFLGFQVSSITTGKVLYTVPVSGFTGTGQPGLTPSHGITLSPDEKTVYVIDTPNNMVHAFDVSGLPNTAPKQIANIPVTAFTGNESPCTYDCSKEGWLVQSLDGRYVFVGNSGDIIDTTTQKVVANLPTLANTRMYLEIDWTNGAPTATTDRYDYYGGVTSGPTPTPTVTVTVSPTPTSTVSPTPTPPPGTTIAQDTFQRANQAHWGTASDSLAWGADANSNAAFSISTNRGQISGNTYYNAVLGPTATDSEVLVTGSLSSFNNSNLGAVLRWQDTNDWYKAYIDGHNLVVQSKVQGTYHTLATVGFTASANAVYSIRFRVVGTTLSAKVWQTSATEPTAWMATATDSSLQSGFCGVRIQVSSTVAEITSFLATALA